ncbi:MAG: undecaprenyl-diphosphate phosphatase [Acidimicrobiia bacterium]
MLSAIIWGLVQGLTEFLPISSSGHLVVVPAFLDKAGMNLAQPSLEVSAVLHLGTLIAVLVYFRADLARLLRFHPDDEAKKLWVLLIVGTIPAVVGWPLESTLQSFQDDPRRVGLALIGTAIILWIGSRFANGKRQITEARPREGFMIGLAQALALIPGISRSGSTISAGSIVGLTPTEAARYSFLLGIPAIAGGGLKSMLDVSGGTGLHAEIWVGLVVAAVAGYLAIAALLALLPRVGLIPFAIYAFLAGVATIIFL